MSESIQAYILVVNNSEETFDPPPKDSVELKWGKTESGPLEIPPGKTIQAYVASGREASASGAEGWVRWWGDITRSELKVLFNAPYVGNNSAYVETDSTFDQNYTVTPQGPLKSGSCVFTVTVNPK